MLPKALGRQYAMLGGDFNPIHIHSSLARLMGFKEMLIHGMYNKARCIAELEKKISFQEHSIEELNEIVTDQQIRIDHLEKQLKNFHEQLASGDIVKKIEDEEPPPHY